ncbi:MAG: MFS transporter [Microscillaceae bacterium]|jgi:MFS family permease|nr:MFS transporter [Microscillaceae bacterium]
MPEAKPSLWTRDFILITFTNLLISAGSFLLIPVLPIYAKQVLKASKTEIGLIISVFTLSALILRPWVGVGLDALGRKPIYLIGLLMFGALLPFYAWFQTVVGLIVLRFLHGFAWGIATTGGSTVASDIVPPARRGEGIGYYGMSFTVAMALGPVLGLALIRLVDYNTLFYVVSGLVFGGLGVALWIKYPRFATTPWRNISITQASLYDARGIPASLVAMVCSGVYGGLISFVTLFTEEKNLKSGLQLLDSGALFFVAYAVGLTLVRPFAGRELDTRGPQRVIIGGLSMLILGIVALAASQHLGLFLGAAFVAGLGMGAILPTALTMVVNLVEPERRGVANSTFFTLVDIGVSIGTLGLGIVANYTSVTTMYYISGAIILIPLGYFWQIVLPDYHDKMNKQTMVN